MAQEKLQVKIYANIDDSALIIKDFLPNNLFKKVANFDYDQYDKNQSYKNWENNLFLDESKNVTMKKVTTVDLLSSLDKGKYEYKNIIFKDVLDVVKNCQFIPFKDNSSLNISFYEYDKYAGINWHDDNGYTLNYSLYIHEDWDRNWGGETLIDTGRGLPLSVYSQPNALVAIKNNIEHKVCAVTGPKKRRVLQIRGIFYE